MRRTVFPFLLSFALSLLCVLPAQNQAQEDPELAQARRARDRADTKFIATAIEKARAQASQNPTGENYIRLALLEHWMCEAANGQQNNQLVKEAAQVGAQAAEKAVSLDANSSDAHWLLGDLLGQLIPHVFGGGMRYGARSTHEIEKALALNEKNANAYVARATAYYFTPSMFGGDKHKAVDMLKKAIELDPASDAAQTAHIWLAQIYHDDHKQEDALREIAEARKTNPDRRFIQYVSDQIAGMKKK